MIHKTQNIHEIQRSRTAADDSSGRVLRDEESRLPGLEDDLRLVRLEEEIRPRLEIKSWRLDATTPRNILSVPGVFMENRIKAHRRAHNTRKQESISYRIVKQNSVGIVPTNIPSS